MIVTVTLNPAVDRELTVPALAFDTVLRASAWRVDCGGKGFNVSRMLMALGAPGVPSVLPVVAAANYCVMVSNRGGIQTDFVWVPGETRTNVSIVSEDHDHYIKAKDYFSCHIQSKKPKQLISQPATCIRPRKKQSPV